VNGHPVLSESVNSVDEAAQAAERLWSRFAESQPTSAHDRHRPFRCAVCGTTSLFRIVSPGPPLDRLACEQCGAQRLEPSHGDTWDRFNY